jgi:hypothetical protein
MTNQELIDAMENSDWLSDITDSVDLEQNTLEENIESVEQRISEHEVIYHYTAMEYLKENDASLQFSLEIASELGFTIENLNSELLATLLQQQEMREELAEITK